MLETEGLQYNWITYFYNVTSSSDLRVSDSDKRQWNCERNWDRKIHPFVSLRLSFSVSCHSVSRERGRDKTVKESENYRNPIVFPVLPGCDSCLISRCLVHLEPLFRAWNAGPAHRPGMETAWGYPNRKWLGHSCTTSSDMYISLRYRTMATEWKFRRY